MRVHFQQLTEPIAPLVDNNLYELTHYTFQIPTQLKSQATRSRRLPESLSTTPRACGDPMEPAPSITA